MTPDAGHPAIALVLAAEARPCFQHATSEVEQWLAVASQTSPESLPPAWVARLAARFADVLVQAGALDRAELWLRTLTAHAEAAEPATRVDRFVVESRLACRRGAFQASIAALGQARAALNAWDRLDPPGAERNARAMRIALATAEYHALRQERPAAEALLVALLAAPDTFASIDDLWRAHRLLGAVRQSALRFAEAAPEFANAADICTLNDAPVDAADALLALGQCRIGAGDLEGGLAVLRQAHAQVPAGHALFGGATGVLVTGLMAAGDLDAALDAARAAGIAAAGADDARAYLEILGVMVSLLRLGRRHEEAYRLLLDLYAGLSARFGEAAGQAVVQHIDLLRADLGEAEFEALSARLLSERTP